MTKSEQRVRAFVFYYVVLPFLNAYGTKDIIDCPCCGVLLQHYDNNGYLHMADGDADCYGVLGVGKGKWQDVR